MIAHNGNLTNAIELRHELEYTGAIFQTTIDSEVIAYHIARERLKVSKAEDAVKNAMKKIEGAYALVVSSPRKMIGARDPFGLKPLCIGKRDNTWFLASESCALAAVGADFIRDVERERLSALQSMEYLRTKVCRFHLKSRHVVFLSTFILHVWTA